MADDRKRTHPALFPSTRWTAILAARSDPALRRAALENLLAPRWRPLYVLARKHGLEPPAADDAVQSFLVRLLESENGDIVARLEPERGSLRAYLKTAFRNHLTNLAQHARAAKRGGGRAHQDVEDLEALLASPDCAPDELYEKAWAVVVFEESLAALETEFTAGVRRGPFEVLRELFAYGSTVPYSELAPRHGMTVAQLKSFVHRAKARFRELLRERVAATIGDDKDLDAEIRHLMEAMG
jgi:RNA polymerase sigma-70 factor (ECF subfamily)